MYMDRIKQSLCSLFYEDNLKNQCINMHTSQFYSVRQCKVNTGGLQIHKCRHFGLRFVSLHVSTHIGEVVVIVCVKSGLISHSVFLAGICQDLMFKVTKNFVFNCHSSVTLPCVSRPSFTASLSHLFIVQLHTIGLRDMVLGGIRCWYLCIFMSMSK